MVGALQASANVVKHQQLDADKIDDLKMDLEEQQAALQERQDLFADYATQNNEGLMDELDAMCADQVAS